MAPPIMNVIPFEPGDLPWKLLKSLAGLSSLSPQVEPDLFEWAARHLRHLADNIDYFREADLGTWLLEQEELETAFKNRRKGASGLDPKRFYRAAGRVGDYFETQAAMKESFHSLVALGFVAAGLSREEILPMLSSCDWSTKHQILGRWGWFTNQRILLQGGEPLPAPYSGRVARRPEAGRTLDREFYTLLLFLDRLSAETGEQLLFVEKSEAPDFIVIDATNRRIGVEVTETSISATWDEERNIEDEIFAAIRYLLLERYVSVNVRVPPSWLALKSHTTDSGPSAFETWLADKLLDLPVGREKVMLAHEGSGLVLELSPAQEPLSANSISRSSEWVGEDVDEAARAFKVTLRERLENKVVKRKSGRLRKPPSICRCDLVVYVNYDARCDLTPTIREFFADPPPDLRGYFNRTWLIDEKRLVRLNPVPPS